MNVTSNSLHNDGSAVQLKVADDLSVTVIYHQSHGFLMTSADVARGYGISVKSVHSHKHYNADDFVEGVHFIIGFNHRKTKNAQPHRIYWTKAGVIRFSFLIKSGRSKMFRDWAEKLILTGSPNVDVSAVSTRKYNRLSKGRLVEILALVAQVDDGDIRRALVTKLVPDQNHSGV